MLNKYYKEIEFVKTLFLDKLDLLKVTGIYIYGSAGNKINFNESKSDIDIIVFCINFQEIDKEKLIEQIGKNVDNFKEKKPILLNDYLCERIEFYVDDFSIPLDITITSKMIPSREILEKNAWNDGFEALMGGIYLNSINIYGEVEDYKFFKENYYPFYDDNLRKTRLDVLANRISKTNERLDEYIKDKNFAIADHLYKIRKYVIKFIFIYYRKYYNNPEKNIYLQLENILNLSDEEKRILCFLDGDIFEIARKFVDLSNKYIDKYELENQSKAKLYLK